MASDLILIIDYWSFTINYFYLLFSIIINY